MNNLSANLVTIVRKYSHTCVLRILAAATAQGRHLIRSELLIMRLLFKEIQYPLVIHYSAQKYIIIHTTHIHIPPCTLYTHTPPYTPLTHTTDSFCVLLLNEYHVVTTWFTLRANSASVADEWMKQINAAQVGGTWNEGGRERREERGREGRRDGRGKEGRKGEGEEGKEGRKEGGKEGTNEERKGEGSDRLIRNKEKGRWEENDMDKSVYDINIHIPYTNTST